MVNEHPHLAWYTIIEIVFIIAASSSLLIGEFTTAVLIFILIELREISFRLKNKGNKYS